MLPVTTEEEGKALQHNNVCADSGKPMTLAWGGAHGINSWILRCPDKECASEHHGIVEKESYALTVRAQSVDRPDDVDLSPRAQPRMMPQKADLERLISLVQIRYPRAQLNHPSTALFIMDCWRLDLDPLLGEIVPVTFRVNKGSRDEQIVVQPLITEDGYLSLAKRACDDKWMGPPQLRPVADANLIKIIANAEDAWVWEARGPTKDSPGTKWDEWAPSYGWMTREEAESDKVRNTPAGKAPGNQARVRAIKRWIRENFPEARRRMIEMTGEWMQRAQGVEEAQQIITAEYTMIGPAAPEGKRERRVNNREPASSHQNDAPQGADSTPPPSGQPTDTESPMRVWDEVRDLIRELKPSEERVKAWWQHYGVEVTPDDFRFDFPHQAMTAELIRRFRDRLIQARAQQAQAPQQPML